MQSIPLLQPETPFPDPNYALTEPDGLLAYGADLSASRLFNAYCNGIFPWFSDGEPILWWSPSERAIIQLDKFHVSKSLAKEIKKHQYKISLNCNFEGVIKECANTPRKRNNGEGHSSETWITDEMQLAYIHLHKLGLAHSIEVWNNHDLVGGLYGVAVGKVFCGESMFHKQSNTSKMAMFALVNHMQYHNLAFIDCQLPTDHLLSLGATTISRHEFLSKLLKRNQTLAPTGELLDEYKKCWKPDQDIRL